MENLVEKYKDISYLFNFPPVEDTANTHTKLTKEAAYLTEQAGELVAAIADDMNYYDVIALTMSVIHRAENIFVGLVDINGSIVYKEMDAVKRDVITIWENRGEYGKQD